MGLIIIALLFFTSCDVFFFGSRSMKSVLWMWILHQQFISESCLLCRFSVFLTVTGGHNLAFC